MDRDRKRLVINKDEAEQVRTIFDLYLQQRGMIPVCQELNRPGLDHQDDHLQERAPQGGVSRNKARLYDILVNVTYIGKVRHQGQLYPGEQDAIVDKRVFREVQKLLQLNSQNGGADTRNKHGALLRGLLKCGHCGAAMAHTYTQPARRGEKGNRLYRYYMCVTRMKRGKDACPTPTLPAQEIEDFVVEQIKTLARDPELQRQVFEEASKQQKQQIVQLESERKRLLKDKQVKAEEIRRLVDAVGSKGRSGAMGKRLGAVEGVAARVEGRIAEVDRKSESLNGNLVDQEAVAVTLREFNGVWQVLHQQEQAQVINLLLRAVTCGEGGGIRIEFRRIEPMPAVSLAITAAGSRALTGDSVLVRS